MADSPELLSKYEVLELANREGIKVSEHQFDRWRDNGLIVAHRAWETPGHGSQSLYEISVLANLSAILTILEKKKNLKRVGWQLWWNGYEVSDKCWTDWFNKPTKLLEFIVRNSRKLIERRDSDDAFAERTSRLKAPLGYVPRSQRRPFININEKGKEDAAASALWMIAEAVSDADYVMRDEGGTITNTISNMAGAKQAQTDHISSRRISISSAVPDFLQSLSELQSLPEVHEITNETNRKRLIETRDDVRNILKLIEDFYEAVSWMYGKNAFGLRAAAWYAKLSNPTLRAALIASWWTIRKAEIYYTSDEIKRLANQAQNVRAQSNKFKSIISSDPKLQKEITPKRLKAAFKNPEKLRQMEEKIRQIRHK